jgi:predicted MFS family arabinose efflux permease
VADPVTAAPEELRAPGAVPAPERALALLRRPGFRRAYAAVAVSEVGDAFQYVALMWVALVAAGPLGVMAVRLADSIPALVFGFHGGVVADRWDRKRAMVAADLVRAGVLVPVTVAALLSSVPIWALAGAAFVLTAATSYFEPAYGALLPALVERRNVQAANGLVQATTAALSVGAWAAAAGLLVVLPIGAFFAFNAASFVLSAALLVGVRAPTVAASAEERPDLRGGFAALARRRALAAAVVAIAAAVTISSGTWIVGVPTLVRSTLQAGAGSFSAIAAAYAGGVVAAGVVLSRRHVRRKALGSMLAWMLYLPAYGLFALAHSLGLALAGGALAGLAQGTAMVLVFAAAQEDVPDAALGRVTGLISLTRTGAHASGLLLVSPLFALVAPRAVFAGAAVALSAIGLVGAAMAVRYSDRTRPKPPPTPGKEDGSGRGRAGV